MLNRLTLLQRILLLVLGSVSGVFALLLLYVGLFANRIERDNAIQEASLLNKANGNKITGIMMMEWR